jgi:hypothetical protein
MRALVLIALLAGARASAQSGLIGGRPPAPARRVVGRGARTIVEEHGAKLWAVRPGGGRLLLDGELPQNDALQTSATMSPFFGRRDLLDVAVQTMWSNGFGGEDRVEHYIVRVGAHGDSLACRFTGEEGGGMEDRNHRTIPTINKLSDEPLIFELVASASSTGAISAGGPRATTMRYQIGPSGMCRAQPFR